MLTPVVDTHALPVADRDRLWKRATAEFLVPLEIATPGTPVSGRISGAQRGDVSVCHLSASAHTGIRTPVLAGGVGSEYYKVAIVTSGTVTVRQHGRISRLRPGNWTVYETGDEYAVGGARPFGLFVALVPHALLAPRVQVAGMSTLVFDSHPATVSLLDAARSGAPLGRALDAVGDLVRNQRRVYRREAASEDTVFREATALIETHLAEDTLGPAYLSAVLGVSRRRLYDIFEHRVGPIARFIRTQRLNFAHAMLRSAANAGLPVSEIAAMAGFSDPAHFSRVFRSTFSCTPSQARSGMPQVE